MAYRPVAALLGVVVIATMSCQPDSPVAPSIEIPPPSRDTGYQCPDPDPSECEPLDTEQVQDLINHVNTHITENDGCLELRDAMFETLADGKWYTFPDQGDNLSGQYNPNADTYYINLDFFLRYYDPTDDQYHWAIILPAWAYSEAGQVALHERAHGPDHEGVEWGLQESEAREFEVDCWGA